MQQVDEPVAHRTRSRKEGPAALTNAIVRDLMAAPVLDEEAGQMLEFRQLRRHPKYK